MTINERIAFCEKLEEGYRAEGIGLRAALLKDPIPRGGFEDEWTWQRYLQGYEDGISLMKQEEVV